MADNTTLSTGTGGDVIATDDIGGIKFQRVKLIEGADGTNDGDISAANPLPVQTPNLVASGALGALNAAVTVSCEGVQGASWEIDTGTLVGTVAFEATDDDANWFAVEAIRVAGAVITSTTTFADRGHFTSVSYSQIRLRVSAYTSGTSNARVEASAGGAIVRLGQALPTGDNTIGRVKLTDGTDLALVTAAGELNVLATAQPGVDIGDVTVNNAAGASAVNVQDGGNSLTVDNAALSVVGGGTEAAALRVTIANDSTGVVSVDDNGASLTVDGTVTANQGGAPWTQNLTQWGSVAVDGATTLSDNMTSPTVAKVGAFQLNFDGTNWDRSLGAANALNSAGGGLQTAQIIAQFDDVAPTSITENQFGNLRMSANRNLYGTIRDAAGNERGVNVNASNELLVAPTANAAFNLAQVAGTTTVTGGVSGLLAVAGNVASDIAVTANPLLAGGRASTATPTAVSADGDAVALWLDRSGAIINSGYVAQDAAVAGNPILSGGRASTAHPTAMSADGDSVFAWMTRSGNPVVTMVPHIGLAGTGAPWALTSKTAQYTTTQTTTVLQAGGASEKLVVTYIQIQAGGTTAGTVQVYFGTAAYSRGTSLAIFDGEFAPSSTLKPGFVANGPWISSTNGDDVLVTTSAAINPLTITVWYYIVT